MSTTFALFVPALFAEELEAEGIKPTTAAMKANERKKDIRRIEGALESLNALLAEHLKARSDLDIYPVE
jgi:hypothetical protein